MLPIIPSTFLTCSFEGDRQITNRTYTYVLVYIIYKEAKLPSPLFVDWPKGI